MITEEQKKRYKELLKERKVIHKKAEKQTKIIFIASILVGAVFGVIIATKGILADIEGTVDIDKSMLLFYGSLFLFIPAFILHIIIHEAGHLVFGLLTGYKFLSFRIYSAIFYKKDGRIHRKKYSIKGTAGQCLMYPPKKKPDGSFPFILYNLGGGIFNFLFSVPFVIPIFVTHNNIIRTIFIVFVFTGILIGITNIIPLNFGLQNDGMNIKSMLNNKIMQNSFYLQLKTNAKLSDGILITAFSLDEFDLPEGTDDTNMLTAFNRLLAYYQQLAINNFHEAKKMLSYMESKSNLYLPITLNVIELEKLFFMIIENKPLEEIASVYEHARLVLTNTKTDVGLQRVKYLYETLLSEEDKKDIMTLINKKAPKKWKESNHVKLHQDFLKLADNFPVSGEAAMFLDITEYAKTYHANYLKNISEMNSL